MGYQKVGQWSLMQLIMKITTNICVLFKLDKGVYSTSWDVNVVQVITDNSPICKAASLLVEAAYPHIFWTPCDVLICNLCIKKYMHTQKH